MARTLFRIADQRKPGSTDIGIKKEVRLATISDDTLSGLAARDGVTPIAGDRVLVKAQTVGADNGIYVAAAGAWARAADADETDEVFSGEVVFVREGTVNANTGWINSTVGAITVGTTAQTFAMFTTMNAVTVAKMIYNELPSGTIDGANTTFTLAATPETGKQALYYNGQRWRPGGTEDYTISGDTITTAIAPKGNPGQTDVLLADYISQ